MENPLKPILTGLDTELAKLARFAGERASLLSKVKTLLPPTEAAHVVSVSIDADTMVVTADSAVWCSRLRYHEDTMRQAWVKADWAPFTKLRFNVGKSPNLGSNATTAKIKGDNK